MSADCRCAVVEAGPPVGLHKLTGVCRESAERRGGGEDDDDDVDVEGQVMQRTAGDRRQTAS